MNLVSTVIALLATIPYITFFLCFLVLRNITKRATFSTKMAADFSTVFFLLSVNGILFMIFNQNFLVWMIVLFLFFTIIILIFQWKVDSEIQVLRAIRIVWRFGFIIGAIGYLILTPVGIYVNY